MKGRGHKPVPSIPHVSLKKSGQPSPKPPHCSNSLGNLVDLIPTYSHLTDGETEPRGGQDLPNVILKMRAQQEPEHNPPDTHRSPSLSPAMGPPPAQSLLVGERIEGAKAPAGRQLGIKGKTKASSRSQGLWDSGPY